MTRSQSRTLCFLRNFFVKYLRYLYVAQSSYFSASLLRILACQLQTRNASKQPSVNALKIAQDCAIRQQKAPL